MSASKESGRPAAPRLNRTPALRYFQIFFRQRKLQHFFGDRIIVYAGILLLEFGFVQVSLFSSITAPGLNPDDIDPFVSIIFAAVFLVLNAIILAILASQRLSLKHDEYLASLGFNEQQILVLARIIILPVTLVTIIWFVFIFALTMPWALRLLTALLMVLFGDALFFALLKLLRIWEKRRGPLPQRLPKREQALLRRFKNHFGAFFQRDLHSLRSIEMIVSLGICLLLTLLIVAYLCLMPYSFSVFVICLYVVLIMTAGMLVYVLYKNENKAYH